MGVLAIVAGWAFILIIMLVVSYLLQAFSIYYVLKNLSYPEPLLAFIPFANMYALSSIVSCYNDGKVYLKATIGIKSEVFNIL